MECMTVIPAKNVAKGDTLFAFCSKTNKRARTTAKSSSSVRTSPKRGNNGVRWTRLNHVWCQYGPWQHRGGAGHVKENLSEHQGVK